MVIASYVASAPQYFWESKISTVDGVRAISNPKEVLIAKIKSLSYVPFIQFNHYGGDNQ